MILGNTPPDCVYFIHAESVGMVKIGASSKPEVRFWAAQGASPVLLTLLAVAAGTVVNEAQLHNMFREHWSHNEWFSAVPEILAIADRIRAGATLDEILAGQPETHKRLYGRLRPAGAMDRCRMYQCSPAITPSQTAGEAIGSTPAQAHAA